LQKGDSVYAGNIHEAGKDLEASPNAFVLMETQTGRGVSAKCTLPMTKAVFWSYHLIACIEPYVNFIIEPEKKLNFDIKYTLLWNR
jgi:hypothetical protein